MITKKFKRGNGQTVDYESMIAVVAKYIADAPMATYDITVGTDSQNHKETKMVEVIAVHRVGDGGIFFYRTEYIPKIRVLKEKIVEETARSIENATGFVDGLGVALIDYDIDIDEIDVNFAVHADIGKVGKTKALIAEITSWIEAAGFDVCIKPDSYAASGVANRISK